MGKYAWFRDNSERTTFSVGEKLPNDWGLYDMHGNVWEFCSDRVGEYPEGAVTDPVGASTGSYRVFRGSSYDFDAKYCVVTNRDTGDPSFGRINTGFRLALSSLSGHSQEVDK